MLPGFEALENVENILVLRVMGLRRTHESTIAKTVVFECPLVLFCHTEGLQTPLVLQFETGFSCAVLDQAEYLNEELRVLDDTSTATDGLVGDILAAYLTFVLYLDELDVSDEA